MIFPAKNLKSLLNCCVTQCIKIRMTKKMSRDEDAISQLKLNALCESSITINKETLR